MAFGIQANPFSFNATGANQANAAFDPNFSALGQGETQLPPMAQAESSDSLSGFGLPENIISDIVSRGAEGINKSQDSALQTAQARASASGFGVSGDVNRAQDQIMSDYAGLRAGNERDVRISAAQDALKNKQSAGGFQAVGGGGGRASSGGGGGGSAMANWLQGSATTPAEKAQANLEVGLQGFQFARPQAMQSKVDPLDISGVNDPRRVKAENDQYKKPETPFKGR